MKQTKSENILQVEIPRIEIHCEHCDRYVTTVPYLPETNLRGTYCSQTCKSEDERQTAEWNAWIDRDILAR